MLSVAEKQAWIVDLESGKYTHGKGKLCVENDSSDQVVHCCLGVLCETLGVKMRGIIYDHGDGLPGESEKVLNRIEDKGIVHGYEFFEKILGIPGTEVAKLYNLNDQRETKGYDLQAKWIAKNVPTRVE